MLSVIIPVYNVEQYLTKCIDSVLSQTYKDLEIILINDGSTDGSGDICKEYAQKDKRIIYVEKKNEGTGKTRNLGIKMARGEYLTFLDSDDWWDEQYAELMVNGVEDVDISICDCMYLDGDDSGDITEKVSKIRLPEDTAIEVKECPDVINRGRTFLWGKVFRKELFERYQIEQPSMAINDFPIVTPLLALAKKVKRVGKPLYYYLRTRPGNTVTSFKALFSIEEALMALRDNFNKYKLEDEYIKPLHKMYYSQVRFALIKGLKAVECGKGSKDEFDSLKQKLFCFLDNEWDNHPIIEGKRFAKPESDILYNGLKLVMYDEKQIVDNDEVETDYCIITEDEEYYESARSIVVNLNYELEGEDLYWDVADKILFAMES